MTSTQRKTRRFEQVVRLRRAERAWPDSRDIVAVRSQLEREIGGTVSQAFAASVLGISHTALGRWVEQGDLPVVITARGRREVPVAVLAELHEAVQAERASGRRRLHALEPVMSAARARARDLEPAALVDGATSGDDPHRRAELRSLAYHRAVAGRLEQAHVDQARHLLWEWQDRGMIDPRHAAHWEERLGLPLAALRRSLAGDDEDDRALRQCSPFAGLLSEAERRRILKEIR